MLITIIELNSPNFSIIAIIILRRTFNLNHLYRFNLIDKLS